MNISKFTYENGEFVKIETPRADRKRVILYRPFKTGGGEHIAEMFECSADDLAYFCRKFRVLKSKIVA